MASMTIAAIQMACGANRDDNIAKAEQMVKQAAASGARIILLQELFETPYFCQTENPDYFTWAVELENSLTVARFADLARSLKVVLPISFFEKRNQARYNAVAVINADGTVMGTYRKTHIPDGPGYEEKFYFNPGDTGFKVWKTSYARIGVGICWDQWFPEAARSMALMDAELILYPTAIGSEPQEPGFDSKDHWQLCVRGHAAANLTPVAVANRVGTERADGSEITFYGSSFITDHQGRILAEADRTSETIIFAELDMDAIAADRAAWGVFRDRRPETYGVLLTSDGCIDTFPNMD